MPVSVYDRWRPVGGATQWWAQEGMIQVAFDNSSSGHFGKKGLNYIHRQLGKYEIEDYMACGKWLRAQPWVDSNKPGHDRWQLWRIYDLYGADLWSRCIHTMALPMHRLPTGSFMIRIIQNALWIHRRKILKDIKQHL